MLVWSCRDGHNNESPATVRCIWCGMPISALAWSDVKHFKKCKTEVSNQTELLEIWGANCRKRSFGENWERCASLLKLVEPCENKCEQKHDRLRHHHWWMYACLFVFGYFFGYFSVFTFSLFWWSKFLFCWDPARGIDEIFENKTSFLPKPE